ncbi:MAG TPA: PspC domain-containing protein [Erythrobacter sp.]|jgi:phage shock protein PspC (stress-responsive transcriptional regulator)|nr:PspC domain-containing protein [Erythrobacter sp.]
MNNITNNPGGKPPRAGFRLDKTSGKVFGVCAGIGDYFGIDPMLVRIGFVLATIFSVGAPVLIYLAIALIAD